MLMCPIKHCTAVAAESIKISLSCAHNTSTAVGAFT